MTPQQIEEDWHGRLAVETARLLGIFQTTPSNWSSFTQRDVIVGDDTKQAQLLLWRQQLEIDANTQNCQTTLESVNKDDATHSQCRRHPPSVTVIADSDVVSTSRPSNHTTTSFEVEDTPPLAHSGPTLMRSVNDEQILAHDIIVSHLKETLAGREPEPLRMMVYGEGGTGQYYQCHHGEVPVTG